jgi:hypothetical protein
VLHVLFHFIWHFLAICLTVQLGVFDQGLNKGIRCSVNHFGSAFQVYMYLECDNIQPMYTPSEDPNADQHWVKTVIFVLIGVNKTAFLGNSTFFT